PFIEIASTLPAHKQALEQAERDLGNALGIAPTDAVDESAEDKEAEEADGKDGGGPQYLLPTGLAAGAVVTGASKAIGAAADLLGWMRADYSISKREVSVGETPLMAALASHLLERPEAEGEKLSVDLDGFGVIADSPLLVGFYEALGARARVKALAERLE